MTMLAMLLAAQCYCDVEFPPPTDPQQGSAITFCVANHQTNLEWFVYVDGGIANHSTAFPIVSICGTRTQLVADLPDIYAPGIHTVQLSATNDLGSAWSYEVLWDVPGTGPPVDCQGFWSDWLRGSCTACVDGQQTCVESRAFNITQQPANGGLACPASPETRSVFVSCTPSQSCRNLVTQVWEPIGTEYLHVFQGGQGPAQREITRWKNEGWSVVSWTRQGSTNRITFRCGS